MRTFAADRNPELRLAQEELESIKRELAKTEGSGGRTVGGAVNGKGIDNLGLLRNLRYNETIYELLAKQYEMAKIDEAKDSAVIQVMDKATEPDRKSKPKRSLIVLFCAFGALFVAVIYAFVRESIAKTARDPAQADRVAAIKSYLTWR
jgi:tyrosine-protein kinase Etk/Wzc